MTRVNLRKHILAIHNSLRPFRAYFAQDGQRRFGEMCYFSHKEVPVNLQRCYRCGLEVENESTLMNHRKVVHKESCKDASVGKCKFNQQTCYLNHSDEEKMDFRGASHLPQPPGLVQQSSHHPLGLTEQTSSQEYKQMRALTWMLCLGLTS